MLIYLFNFVIFVKVGEL